MSISCLQQSARFDAGNRVVFDNEGSFIFNKATGKQTSMRRDKGVYKFDMWLKKQKDQCMNSGIQSVCNGTSVFARLDVDML